MAETCRGVFGPCSNLVTHHLEALGEKGEPIPLCDEHWDWAMELEKTLGENPEFKEKFAKAVDEASRPSRYQRKPLI